MHYCSIQTEKFTGDKIERIKARYPDAGGEDYLFLPDYPNRTTASRIFGEE